MAQPSSVDPFEANFTGREIERLPLYRRLGLLNGAIIGLGLGLGAWGMEAWRVWRLPTTAQLPVLLLGLALVVVLCGFVGWLSSRIARTPITVILWALTAVLAMLIMGYLPYYGRTLVVWLSDARFRGLAVFPYTREGGIAALVLGGILIILVLAILGLLQSYRLESIASEAGHRGRVNGRAWRALLLPLPLVLLAALITQGMMANPTAPAIDVTNRAIVGAQNYEGDLRTLDRGDGISYAALRPVQGAIDGEFTLSIVDVNPLNSTVIVRADFANGAWVYCRVINDQLSFCYDAALAYVDGLRVLVTGRPAPEECRGCVLQATDEAAAWLVERRDRFGDNPTIERAAQQGSHVLMRVSGADIVAECWVVGVTPTRLTECREVEQ